MTADATPKDDCLASALAAAQADYAPIVKDLHSPAFGGYDYADLAAVLASLRPSLSSHGIAVLQRLDLTDQGETVLLTELRWRDEKVASRVPLKLSGLDNQKAGIVLTYWRRYSLLALCGAHPEKEDQDGDLGAVAAQPRRPQPKQESPRRLAHDSETGEVRQPAAPDDRGDRTFALNGKRFRADDWIVEADRVARALEPGKLGGFLEATKAVRNEIYKAEAAARERLMALSEDLKARALGAAASEGAPQ